MGKIVAIGGGEIRTETLAIDRYVVGLSEKPNPKLLFIPTASGDPQGYVDAVRRAYGSLGCEVDSLLLVDTDISEDEIRRKILSADIVYVGGGDTVRMIEIWKSKKVDAFLKEAYEKRTVLSGLSAGSICWFQKGHSDSESFKNPDGSWDYVQAPGIGLIPAVHCPHYNEEGRKSFDGMMKGEKIPGIALENNCALVVKDGMYRIVKSDDQRKAYLLRNDGGTVSKTELTAKEFTPLSDIL